MRTFKDSELLLDRTDSNTEQSTVQGKKPLSSQISHRMFSGTLNADRVTSQTGGSDTDSAQLLLV